VGAGLDAAMAALGKARITVKAIAIWKLVALERLM
jgi:hypothetical protein